MPRLPKSSSLHYISASYVRPGWPLGFSSPSGPLPSDFNAGGAGEAKQWGASEASAKILKLGFKMVQNPTSLPSKSLVRSWQKPRSFSSFMAKNPVRSFVVRRQADPRSFSSPFTRRTAENGRSFVRSRIVHMPWIQYRRTH